MKKYLIKWDAGYGENCDVIMAHCQKEADNAAYEAWREEAESNATYQSEVFTRKIAEDYGLEDEIEDTPHDR